MKIFLRWVLLAALKPKEKKASRLLYFINNVEKTVRIIFSHKNDISLHLELKT